MRKSNLAVITVLALAVTLAVIFSGCTENARVKTFGGTATYDLPVGEKLVLVTWKESQLWYLTRPMNANDSTETYKFSEKSSFGIAEGTYILIEHK